jgi:hypothetical protein
MASSDLAVVLDIQEVESFWDAVRVRSIKIQPVEQEDEGPEVIINRALAVVTEKFPAIMDRDFLGASLTSEVLTGVLTAFAREMLTALFEQQRKSDSSVLIQLFLEVPSMSPIEVKAFLRTLPREFVNRILLRLEKNDKKTGLQALLSVEAMYRDQLLHQDYEVERTSEGTLVVTVHPENQGGALSFRLREMFA